MSLAVNRTLASTNDTLTVIIWDCACRPFLGSDERRFCSQIHTWFTAECLSAGTLIPHHPRPRTGMMKSMLWTIASPRQRIDRGQDEHMFALTAVNTTSSARRKRSGRLQPSAARAVSLCGTGGGAPDCGASVRDRGIVDKTVAKANFATYRRTVWRFKRHVTA